MVNRNRRLSGLLIGGSISVLTAVSPAVAQVRTTNEAPAATSSGIEDIVVTARRSAENVQSVPIAVTAIGDQALTDANVRDVQDLQNIVPNVYVSAVGNGGRAEFAIRGIRGVEGTLTSDEPVGIYIDEVNYPRVYGLRSAFFDVERIEVLRGPQGTLFGRNNTGGAVSIVTKRPSDEWGGYGEVMLAEHGTLQFQGALNAPVVTDQLAVRVATQISRRDGYGDNPVTGKDVGDDHTNAFRSHVLFTPSDNTSFLLSADYIESRNDGNAVKIINVRPLSNPGSIQTNRVLPIIIRDRGLGPVDATTLAQAQAIYESYAYGAPGIDFYDDHSSLDRFDNVTLWGVSGTLNVDLGGVEVKSITAYRDVARSTAFDYDGIPFILVDNPRLRDSSRNLSQEIQVASQDSLGLDWIIGIFANWEQGREESYTPFNELTRPGESNINDGDITNDSQAIFGQATYHFGERVRLTGGLRYTREGRKLISRNRTSFGTCLIPANNPGICQATFDTSFKYLSYLLSLDYRPTERTMIYLNTSRAQRSGGFPLRGGTNVATFEAFEPETATNYEIGLKTDLLDRRLRVNLAGYYTDYKNVQKSANVYTEVGLATVLRNAASAEIYGAEAEITAVPVEGLTLTASGGWTKAKYTAFNDALLGDLSGYPFAFPEFTYSLGASYEVPASFGSVRASVNYRWADDVMFHPQAYQPEMTVQKAYGLLEARLATNVDAWGVEVALFGSNLTDKKYYNNISTFDASYGYNLGFVGEPRTIGVSIRKTFGGE